MLYGYLVVGIIVFIAIYSIKLTHKAMNKLYDPTGVDNYFAKINQPLRDKVSDIDYVLNKKRKKRKVVFVDKKYFKK